jgi:hypothetical protein
VLVVFSEVAVEALEAGHEEYGVVGFFRDVR